MTEKKKVVVFGAGLVGLSTAFALVRAGHDVTVIEKDVVGSGAAEGNAGEVTPLQSLPMPEPSLLKEVFRGVFSSTHYLSIAPLALPSLAAFGLGFMANCTLSALRRNTENLDQLVRGAFAAFDSFHEDGISLGGGGRGFLNTHVDEAALKAFRDGQVARADLLGMERPGEIMYGQDLFDYEPAIIEGSVTMGFEAHTERYLDPLIFCHDLAREIRNRGGEIIEGAELIALGGHSAVVKDHEGNKYQTGFDKAVVTVGAWTNGSISGLPKMDSKVVTAGTGYSFHADLDTLPKRLVMSLNRKTIAMPMSGTLRVIGLMDFGNGIERYDQSRMNFLRSKADEFVKDLKDAPIYREWTGPRPMTTTGLPIISPLKDNPDVIVSAGHNMHGLSLGPVTGELITSMVENRPGVIAGSTVDMRPFAF